MELVYNVILQAEGFTENNYCTQQLLGPLGRAMILQALDTVGIYVREDPFRKHLGRQPNAALTAPCTTRRGTWSQ